MADSQHIIFPKVVEGFCQCGCGQRTAIAKKTDHKKGWLKNKPVKYCSGHNTKASKGPKWNGGVKHRHDGYIAIQLPNHPHANKAGYVLEHILIAEKVLGKSLPPTAQVHHVNGIPNDNRHDNLVVCDSLTYHKLIHARERAFNNCGNPSWRKCQFCKHYDDPANLCIRTYKNKTSYYHRECRNSYYRLRKPTD